MAESREIDKWHTTMELEKPKPPQNFFAFGFDSKLFQFGNMVYLSVHTFDSNLCNRKSVISEGKIGVFSNQEKITK